MAMTISLKSQEKKRQGNKAERNQNKIQNPRYSPDPATERNEKSSYLGRIDFLKLLQDGEDTIGHVFLVQERSLGGERAEEEENGASSIAMAEGVRNRNPQAAKEEGSNRLHCLGSMRRRSSSALLLLLRSPLFFFSEKARRNPKKNRD